MRLRQEFAMQIPCLISWLLAVPQRKAAGIADLISRQPVSHLIESPPYAYLLFEGEAGSQEG